MADTQCRGFENCLLFVQKNVLRNQFCFFKIKILELSVQFRVQWHNFWTFGLFSYRFVEIAFFISRRVFGENLLWENFSYFSNNFGHWKNSFRNLVENFGPSFSHCLSTVQRNVLSKKTLVEKIDIVDFFSFLIHKFSPRTSQPIFSIMLVENAFGVSRKSFQRKLFLQKIL